MDWHIQQHPMTSKRLSYIIRDIDPAFWRQVKIQAAREGKPIRTVILEFLAHYAQRADA